MDRTVMMIEACARAAYEANLAYCRVLGDESFKPWDQAEQWQKDSCLAGVEGALAGNTPEKSHEAWLAHKAADGWKYGPVKDPEKKEHPCYRPYAELPPEQRAKDDIYLCVVRALAIALLADLPRWVPIERPLINGEADR